MADADAGAAESGVIRRNGTAARLAADTATARAPGEPLERAVAGRTRPVG